MYPDFGPKACAQDGNLFDWFRRSQKYKIIFTSAENQKPTLTDFKIRIFETKK
jgi:hypothetical protein